MDLDRLMDLETILFGEADSDGERDYPDWDMDDPEEVPVDCE